ncbi:hypothetical protein NE237_014385 [Protea cynaroides]|uniref:CRIB domain-containing protein n=1 Tax=Protea cynaroides TaxID=273540 RepID=A0A9Q0KC21_9MAGN|nr:hypothetical protein NE237_014385 [Protea cynaroides]
MATNNASRITLNCTESSSKISEAVQTLILHPKNPKEILQPLEMSTKMKGILKGLRYISQIFDNGKEQEMQIGHPTDVKHVAHIGWDGPSVHSPTWVSNCIIYMFKYSNSIELDLHRTGAGINGSLSQDLLELPKPSRRQQSTGTILSFDSTSRDQPKQRRHQSTAGVGGSVSSPSATDGSSRASRRPQNTGLSMDSSLQEQPVEPKKSRRKKSNKELSSGGSTSTRPSRSKAQSTATYNSPFSDPGHGALINDLCPASPLKSIGDGKGDKGNHGIS